MFSSAALPLVLSTQALLPMPAALVSIENTRMAEVEAITRSVERDGGWWLELEHQLLIAAPPARYAEVTAGRKHQDLGLLRPEDLVLQSRTCGVAHGEAEPALAEAGRFALVRAPQSGRVLQHPSPEPMEWHAVQPNRMLARDLSARGLTATAKAVDPVIQRAVDEVNGARWFAALEHLTTYDRHTLSPEIDQARDWLVAQYDPQIFSVTTQTFPVPGTTVSVENVIATLPGTVFPNQWLVVGGHYDSRQSGSTATNTPGAEDNASGCAGVLETARVFARYRPERTMKFVCFAGEEQGLHGGNFYVQSLFNSGDLSKVQLAVIMDMIGYSGDADLDLLLETSSALSSVFGSFQTLSPTYTSQLRLVTTTSYGGSDHVPFIQRGVPSLLTIENDWNSYSHYHRSSDIPTNVTRALEMGVGILKLNVAVLTQAGGSSDFLHADSVE